MNNNTDEDRLADIVNHEPIVFMDCTQSELLGSALIAFIAGMFIGVVVGIAISWIMVGLILGLLLTMGICYVLLHVFKSIRQKYYPTWIKEKMFLYKTNLTTTFGGSARYVGESKRYAKGGRRRV